MLRTHLIDGLLKLFLLAAMIFIFINIPFFDHRGILLLFTTVSVGILLYVYIFRTLGSYLYAKWILKMRVNWSQAKMLNQGLSPFSNHFMTWLPLKEVKNLDDAIKYETAIQIIDKWKVDNQIKQQQAIDSFKKSSNPIKAIKILYLAYLAICLLASFLNIPPASYVIEWYCVFFEDNTYPPMLIWGLMVLPVAIPLLLLRKKYGFEI